MRGTRGYFLGFLCGGVVAALIMTALVGVAFADWFFGPVPTWFTALMVFAGVAPYVFAGILAQLMSKRRAVRTWPAFLVLMGVIAVLGLLSTLGEGVIFFLLLPSALALSVMVGQSGVVPPLLLLVGALLAPILYHIGWHIAGIKKKPGEG